MGFKRLINTSDMNWWLVFASIGCNLILMAVVAFGAASMLRRGGEMVEVSQIVLLLGTFLAAFLTAMLTGWIARGNGVTYGLIGSVGTVVVVLVALPFGVLTILLIVIAVAGGLNGGLISVRRQRRRRR